MRKALLGVFLVASASAFAGIELPQASPAAAASLKVGTTNVTIEYHRPAVKGRAIWGGLVPYEQVWRLGANEATTFEVSDPVKVAGHDVPAGTYALFAVPGRDTWTIVLNKQAKQWGAFSYKQDQDLVRFQVTPTAAPFKEWMALSVEPTGPQTAEVVMTWEKLRVAFPVEVDVPGLVWGTITRQIANPDASPEDFFQAAKYSLDQGGHRDEALGWAEKALAGKPMFWTLELKARLLQREGRTSEALPLVDKAIADSVGKAPKEYTDMLKKVAEEWKAASAK
ncbi:MAG: DUF2911 domain-containing protein [Acidobacteriia bacterium]|nr:DUF2911 domain-containing protein [Terriglobia bacterium]